MDSANATEKSRLCHLRRRVGVKFRACFLKVMRFESNTSRRFAALYPSTMPDIVRHGFDFVAYETGSEAEMTKKCQGIKGQAYHQ